MGTFCDSLYSVFLFNAILGLDLLGRALSRSLGAPLAEAFGVTQRDARPRVQRPRGLTYRRGRTVIRHCDVFLLQGFSIQTRIGEAQ
jgi:hypothetical protein